MHTNSTPNYNLPQFVGTDIINPLTDINDAYSTIDTTMKNIADGEAADANAITALQTAVGDSASGLVKAVNDLKAQNGDSVLTTSAQTLSGAINELDGAVNVNTGNISTLVQKVGSDTLNTVAQTCTGAINEVNNKVSNYKLVTKSKLTIVSNGIKTYKEILNELATSMLSIIQNIANDEIVDIESECIMAGSNTSSRSGENFTNSTTEINISPFYIAVASTFILTVSGVASNTLANCKYLSASLGTTPSISITDLSDTVPENGAEFTLYYNKYKIFS